MIQKFYRHIGLAILSVNVIGFHVMYVSLLPRLGVSDTNIIFLEVQNSVVVWKIVTYGVFSGLFFSYKPDVLDTRICKHVSVMFVNYDRL